MINEISHHRHFPLTEDEKKCTFCPFRSYCSRGSQAGALDDAEADSETASAEFNLNYEQIAEIEF